MSYGRFKANFDVSLKVLILTARPARCQDSGDIAVCTIDKDFGGWDKAQAVHLQVAASSTRFTSWNGEWPAVPQASPKAAEAG